MSLVFAAFVPHPPILHEEIGQDKTEILSDTLDAFNDLEKELYISKPDTIILISPHGEMSSSSFTINAHPKMKVDLSDFGDLITREEYKGDSHLASQITEASKLTHIPVNMSGSVNLDYGVSIPLLKLAQRITNPKVISIHPSDLNAKSHIDFGYMVKDVILASSKRIALIASGDLSHRLTTYSPGGFHKSGQAYDEKIREIISNSNVVKLMNMKAGTARQAASCAFKPLLIFYGIIGRMHLEPEILEYEAPTGVGYLTTHFALH